MIDWIVDDGIDAQIFPDLDAIIQTVHAALRAADIAHPEQAQLSIRIVSDATIRELNRQWRGSDKATDVLAFPMQHGPQYTTDDYLGDIALAYPFVADEAARLQLSLSDHLRHLLVHATLHLVGFDHAEARERQRMQRIERAVLAELGLHDPYAAWRNGEAQ